MTLMERAQKLSERLAALVEEDKALRLEIERLEAVNQIQCLLGEYMTIHNRHSDPKLPSMLTNWLLFADREDTSTEVAMNAITLSREHFRRLTTGLQGSDINVNEGCMYEHTLCSPQICIAGDGQTAVAVWDSPSHETDSKLNDANPTLRGHPVATWCLGRYKCTFTKESGEWKIWHYHYYRIWRVPFYQSWVDWKELRPTNFAADPVSRELSDMSFMTPDLPTSYFHVYRDDTMQYPIPQPPAPYDTWRYELCEV